MYTTKEKPAMPSARDIFDKYAKDNQIGYNDFRELCYSLGHTFPSDEEFDIVVRLLDADGNRYIDYDEFIAWYSKDGFLEKLQLSDST